MTNYPLLSNQQEIWLEQMLHPNAPLYNIGGHLRIDGLVDPILFEQALNQVIQENDALRIVLCKEKNLPTQTFLEQVNIKLDFQDFSNKDNPHQEAIEWMQQEFVKPFQLYDTLLFKFGLFKIAHNCYYSFQKYHHIIVDGWAISLIVQRIASTYNAILAGKSHNECYSYLDFIKNDIAYLSSEKFVQHQCYWQEKYRKLPEPFLVHRHATQGKTISSQRSTLYLKRLFYNQLTEFATRNKVSTLHVILGVLYCYFVRTYNRDDFIIGLPTLNRYNAVFKKTVGLFISSSPAWFKFGTELNFIELIQAISKELKKDYRNQRFPLGEINRQIGQSLFDFVLSYTKHDYDTHFNGNPVRSSYLINGCYPQKEALFIFIEEFHQHEDVNIYFDYNLGAFNKDEIEQIKFRFEFLLKEVLLKHDIPIRELQIMPDAELNKLLVEFNDTQTDYPHDKTIVDLFEGQVNKTPEAIAVIFEDKQLTYRELNNRANQLAHYLQQLGVKAEVLVGIFIERSLEMIIGMLGILKAGGAYLPLDPTYPKARLAFMLEDAQVSTLLTQEKLVEQLPAHQAQILCLDTDWEFISKSSNDNLSTRVQSTNLVYVIYTSGSTGKPKGVQISHKNLLNLVFWHVNAFSVTSKDRVTHLASLAFDASVWELWPYLSIGVTIYLINLESIKASFWNWLAENKITISFLPTPLLEELLSLQLPENLTLRILLIGGDKLHKFPSNSLPFQVINNYGPTENTVVTTSGIVISNNKGNTLPNIGRPINNVQTYILDHYQNPVPINIPGELYISGSSLSSGYLNHPELTTEKFISNPFNNKSRLYKTGDLARYLPDGNIEFLGRIDNQVKIRGFRIELDEIRAVLSLHPSVRENVVIYSESNKLIAYVIPKLNHSELIFDESFQESQSEHISNWEHIYKDVYSRASSEIDPSFNITGWNSSYTGLPTPAEEMREWVDSTVNIIMSLQPNNVLEMGCGTGLLLSRIAPHCQKYWGTDFSPAVLTQLEQLKNTVNNLGHVKLLNRKADDFTGIEPESFDTVVINSVIQYFPSITYLLEVLEKAIKVVKPGGHIFIGDVRNLKLLKAYQTSVQLYKAPDSLTASELQPTKEEELLIEPSFFIALKQHFSELQNVQIQLKRGHHVNELTKFRYEVILQVGHDTLPKVEIPWQNWQSLETLQQNLLEEQPDILGLRNVLNSRLETDIKALEWLINSPEETVGQWRQAKYQPIGIDPEEFWKLADELPYTVIISWASGEGCYDVLFKHKNLQNIQTFEAINIKPWHQYANNPLQGKLAETLIPQLRLFLQKQLPEYMIPSAFVLLDSIPLTPNGKVDRQALSKLSIDGYQLSTETFVAPRTPEEELLAGIWTEVLDIEQVGVHDNFFELGGHSLLATQVISRIRDIFKFELPLRELFEAPTIADLSKQLNRQQSSLPPITPVNRSKPLQLSFAQQRLWFLSQLEGASPTYNMPAALRLEGALNRNILEQSLQALVQRHESLRTTFTTVNGKPITQIANVDYQLLVINLQDASSSEIELFINEEAQKPFDLETGPLFRTKLLQLGTDLHILLINMHHIISDGWSVGIFIREWNIIYKALAQNETIPLAPLPFQYVDYAHWQRQWLTEEILEQQANYWKQQLADMPALLELPTDKKRSPIQSFKGASLPFSLSSELTLALKQLSQRVGTTLFMTLWSAFAVLLSRYSGQSDIVVGSPIANRIHSQTESIIGFFVNTLALRLDLNNNSPFEKVLQQAQQIALEAYSHQDIPFEQLVEILQPARNLSHTPLFQVMFVLQNVSIPDLKLAGLRLTFLELENVIAKFDLTLSLEETVSGLVGTLEYNTDLFEHATIERLSGHLQTLLAGIVENSKALIYELPLLTIAEQQQFLVWNETKTDYPDDKTIIDLFEQQVDQIPENIAVVFENQHLTYQELNTQANQLAHYLQTLGVKPEVLVGICVERSLEMIIGLLGILKAGGAYLPLDPTYPNERLAFMLEDAQVSVLLTQSNIKRQKTQAQTICLDIEGEKLSQYRSENIRSSVNPENLAYVIYTSGSTGKPKGIAMKQGPLVNLLHWQRQNSAINSKTLQFASINFDVSFQEIFSTWYSGGRLVLITEERRKDTQALIRFLEKYEISRLFVPFVVLQSLAVVYKNSKFTLTYLREIITAGEQLQITPAIRSLFKELKDCTLSNHYGPSESHVVTSFNLDKSVDNWKELPPIGCPISNIQVYILDSNLQPLPINTPGELHIGGAGLARGYLNRPELTAEKFIKNHFSKEPSSRLYKTGDLARYLPDGNIEFLGRIDNQVKIRGFRIEICEIETVLAKHSLIQEAVIISKEIHDNKQLIAYIALNNQEQNKSSLIPKIRQFLQKQLPEYMIPSAFMLLDSIPLTPNGKVDRQVLSKLSVDGYQLSTETYVAPRTPEEELLAGIWKDILGIKQVGVHDNFFELGGHSLLATQVISRIRDIFKVELPLRELFEAPTIADLSKQLNRQQSSLPPITPVNRSKPLQLSFAQQRLWFLSQLEGASATYNMPAALRLEGALNRNILEQSLQALVQRHESLRTTFTIVNNKPVIQLANVDHQLPVVNLQEASSSEVELFINEEAQKTFDLETGPLFRTKLLQLGADLHILLINMHHVISDGWSINILVREWGIIYKALAQNEAIPLPPLPFQYVDYAHWQRQWLTEEILEQQANYWKQQLADMPALLELPTDKKRPPIQSFKGSSFPFTLSAELTLALKQLSQQVGTTLFMTLWSAFAVLLSRYSGQSDIVVGSPIANRIHSQTESIIGFFVNTLALRLDLNNNPPFEKVLQQAQQIALEAYSHQDIPFEQLVEILQPERNLSHTPLLQVIFALQKFSISDLKLVGLHLTVLELENVIAKFDLTLLLEETASGLAGTLEYNTDLFERATIERLSGHLQTLLAGIVENPKALIHELPLLTIAEQQQFLVWNNTKTDYPHDKTIVDLFEKQVDKTPEAIAVIFEDKQLTYRELNNQANQLAHYLQQLEIKPEILVGIFLERSLKMIIGLLGVLKAGGAYLPLDPAYPKARLAFMLEDAQVPMLLTQEKLVEQLPAHQAQILCLDTDWELISKSTNDNLSNIVQSSNLSYVIYTSGSTGKPKGVQISHKNLLNLVFWHVDAFSVTSKDRITHLANLAFDASVWELWPYLSIGATIYLIDLKSIKASFWNWLAKNKITISFLPTPLLEELLSLQLPKNLTLRILLIGGDKLHEYPSNFLPFQVVNNYGPAENTVVTTSGIVISNNKENTLPNIGRPINNVQTYILDHYQNPVPINIPGELYISGSSLSSGYLNHPELTTEKFISNPFNNKSRLYKTGDLARYLPDGNIEFLGRIDNQVKIRGFRIELDEIRAVLSQHPSVQETIVIYSESDKLIAYVIPELNESALISDESFQESQSEHVSHWEHIYKEVYSQFLPEANSTFNITGWNSSYTGLPIQAEEMREWVDSTVNVIMSLQPNNVLEMGCGTGLLLSRIAPHCQKYWGTDFSPAVLTQLEQLKNTVNDLGHVKLFNRKADDFTGIEPESFDTVVINSVIQYFPSVTYLLEVLEKAIKVVKPGGHIFIGDIRNLKLLKAYQTSVQLYKAPDSLTASKLQPTKEEELLIEPSFFIALKQHFSELQNVQIHLKRGHYVNELTKFRYEVILQVGHDTLPKIEIPWQDWQSLEILQQNLLEEQPNILGVRNVPNSRLETDIKALEWLINSPEETVGQWRQAKYQPIGIDPEEFWKLADELPYTVIISWANDEGCYNVLFKHKNLQNIQTFEAINIKPWHQYANNPLQGKLAETLIPQFRQFLQEQLPEYMIPSAFVLLDSIPLTPNGKVDRQALSKLSIDGYQLSTKTFVAPRTPEEESLANIWEDILGIKQVGIHDNFFELGGHSLLATQMISRIRHTFAVELPLREVFKSPTVETLVVSIKKMQQIRVIDQSADREEIEL